MTTLSQSQLEALWVQAGGNPKLAATMAAITVPESSSNPAAVQQGQPYSSTGWGLWQITPGNSEPQYGTNQALLNPLNNARAAVAKEKAQGLNAWTTFTSGKYLPYLTGSAFPASTGMTGGTSPAMYQGGATVSSVSSSATGTNIFKTIDNLLNPSFGGFSILNPGSDAGKIIFMLVARGGLTILGLGIVLMGVGFLGVGAFEDLSKHPAVRNVAKVAALA